MARKVPTIRQDILTYFNGDECLSLHVGTPAWYMWLSHVSTFSFQSAYGSFTARKERFQRGGWYWKAYRRYRGKLSTAYLGKSEYLTLEHLIVVAQALASATATSISHTGKQADELVVTEPLLGTKLSIPILSSPLLLRPRLYERLQEGMKHPLTLVSAAAGWGKTTVLSQWAVQCPHPVAWISLERNDNDPIRFWSLLLAALETLYPGLSEPLWGLLRSATTPASLSILLTTLLNTLATFSQSTVLIFDDYHAIEAQPIHEALSFLLEHLPGRVQIVLASRSEPPLLLGRWRASNNLVEIRDKDLSFTPTETVAFFTDVRQLSLSSAAIGIIAARTEGWIAGLQLAATSLQHHGAEEGMNPFTGEDRYVMDYLMEEVLNYQSKTLQDFLLKTSILDSLTAALCEEVTGQNGGQDLLESLERTNLFLVPLDNKRAWYRYHHLFADFLRQVLQHRNPEMLLVLRSRASRWYERHGFAAEAIAQALACADWDRVMQLAASSCERMIALGQHAMLQRWLEALPPTALRVDLHLSINYLWTLIHTGQTDACEAHLQELEQACRGDGNQRKLGEFFALRSSIAVTDREPDLALATAQQALARIPENDVHQQVILNTIQSKAYIMAGNVPCAHEHAVKARTLSEEIGDYMGLVQSFRYLGEIESLKGELHAASDYYQCALKLVQDPSLCWLAADLHLKLGNIYREWNSLDLAQQHIQQAVQLSQQGVQRRSSAYAYLATAQLLFSQGEVAVIQPMLEAARERMPRIGRKDIICRTEAYAVRIWLRQEQFDKVAQWVEAHMPQTDLAYECRVEYLTLARAFIALRRPEKALHLLKRLLLLAEKGRCAGDMVEILMLKALAHYVWGEREHALVVLEKTLLLAEPQGYMCVFLDEGELMGGLLRYAAKHELVSHYVQVLLTAYEKPTRQLTSFTFQSLTAREREVLQMVGAGDSNQEIAQQLCIALNTVKKHVSSIYNKLGATSRAQVIVRMKVSDRW